MRFMRVRFRTLFIVVWARGRVQNDSLRFLLPFAIRLLASGFASATLHEIR